MSSADPPTILNESNQHEYCFVNVCHFLPGICRSAEESLMFDLSFQLLSYRRDPALDSAGTEFRLFVYSFGL